MARRPDVQYIRFYTDGSAARQIEQKPEGKKKQARAAYPRRQSKIVIHLDPLPLAGILISAVMMVLMVVGLVQLCDAQAQAQRMDSYVQKLTQENERLTEEYKSGYDLSAVGEMALALGMVPAEQIDRIPIAVTIPEPEPEPSAWEQFVDFLSALLA